MRYLRRVCAILTVVVIFATAAVAADRGIGVTGADALTQAGWGTYHALIIGIDDYQQWPRLRTAVKDATVLSQVLVDRYGFKKNDVILRTDAAATRLQITQDIRAMAASMKPDDNLLVYYAGHGQLDELTGDGYWIPVEGDANNPSTWVSNSYLKAIFSSEKVAAKNVVVIADSCYSGAMLRGGPSLLTVDGDYRTKLVKAAARRSRQIISSGGLEPVTDGGAEGHSLFAFYFINALKENDREVVDLENLFHTRVWKPVTEIGGQRPSVGRLKTPMDRDGQFVLYNQAWVAEQERRAEEQRRLEAEHRAEEEAGRQKAVAADQMAAIQAERQRMEIERQKLALEKELLAQKLELERLKLEKEKQAIALQRQAAQNAERPSPPPTLKVAAISPEIASAPKIGAARKLKVALFPHYYKGGKGQYGSGAFKHNDDECIRGIVKAIGRDGSVELAYAYAESEWLPPNTTIIDDQLTPEVAKQFWKQTSYFDPLPSPQSSIISKYGQKIGADLVIFFRGRTGGQNEAHTLEIYLMAPKTGETVSEKTQTLDPYPMQYAERLTQTLLAKKPSKSN